MPAGLGSGESPFLGCRLLLCPDTVEGAREFCGVSLTRILVPFIGVYLVAETQKNLSVRQETGFNPWVKKTLCRRKWQSTSVFLPGEFHGQRSLAGSTGSQRVRHD